VAVRHLHEAEATGLAGVTISNNTDLVHSTIRLEELAEVIIRHTVRKIANILRIDTLKRKLLENQW